MASSNPKEVELLILGAGWTSTFLIPQLRAKGISYAATSTTGRDGTIKFNFEPRPEGRVDQPTNEELVPYRSLPYAKTILITFPLKGEGQSAWIVDLWRKTHAAFYANWIQLGSTGIWQADGWNDHGSEYDKSAPRAVAEDELIGMNGVVLNLAGLWGGSREPKNWVSRVAKTKDQLKDKGALHLIHGDDVARAIIAVHGSYSAGERWILTDRHVYDWWDLVDAWGDDLTKDWKGDGQGERPEYRKWVRECMEDERVQALPRSTERLGRLVDSREFWRVYKLLPEKRLLVPR